MSSRKSSKKISPTIVNQDETLTGDNQIHESFMAHAMQIMSENGVYTPTERQVDKILELQEKGMDYSHLERTQVSQRQLLEIGVFVIIITTLLGLLFFVQKYAPDYLGETITGVIGLFTGGFGGYGYAQTKVKKDVNIEKN